MNEQDLKMSDLKTFVDSNRSDRKKSCIRALEKRKPKDSVQFYLHNAKSQQTSYQGTLKIQLNSNQLQSITL